MVDAVKQLNLCTLNRLPGRRTNHGKANLVVRQVFPHCIHVTHMKQCPFWFYGIVVGRKLYEIHTDRQSSNLHRVSLNLIGRLSYIPMSDALA